ncbi:MAG: hypothetical protein M1839_008169 [Geoglossum umbratile]|nr:MAG: hypothetical protein M1839_008169 [Geoglossum umbratile]
MRDIFKRTPLLVASQYGMPKVTAALLSVGADANVRDTDGRSTPEVAAEGGHSLIVTQLLKAEAGPDTKEHIKEARSISDPRKRDGKTARDLALEKGHTEIIRLLEEKAMEFDSRDFFESTDMEFQVDFISIPDLMRPVWNWV